MTCNRCKETKFRRLKFLGDKVYCKHCYGAVTRGISAIEEYL